MTDRKGTNREIRRKNKNRIFRYVRQNGRSSNPVIAEALNMSLPTVLQNTKELQEEGVFFDAGELESTGGRKAKTVDIQANFRYAIGIEITQNHIVLVLTNLIGANLDRERVAEPFRNEESYYKYMSGLLESFIDRNEVDREKLLGVGIAIPGIVNHDTERIVHSYALGLDDFPIRKIAVHIPYRSWFMNDANAGAFAEGARGELEDHFFYLSLNNSVGGGFFDRKGLLYGDNYQCGEIGHMILVQDAEKCSLGNFGYCSEICSARRLAEAADNSLEAFFEKLHEGDIRIHDRWHEYVHYLALLIYNLHRILDYDIVIGGYVGSAMGSFIDDIREAAEKLEIPGAGVSYIRPCSFHISQSAFGAALHEIEGFVDHI